jgi:hypothetical protein
MAGRPRGERPVSAGWWRTLRNRHTTLVWQPTSRLTPAVRRNPYAVTLWKSALRFTRFISPASTRPGPIS